MQKTISIQGGPASFHDIATHQYLGDSTRIYCDDFPQTFESLSAGESDLAVVAIENSLYGSINPVYDLILKHQFVIIGEIYLRVEQCLIGLPGAQLKDAKDIYSHPVALAQCEEFLDENLTHADRHEFHDTADSARHIKELGSTQSLAIASRQAAKLYGLEVLAESIETNKANYTRFVVLVKQPSNQDSSRKNKTSLVITTNHQPGALHHALGTFAKRSINLDKIQSRPIIGKAWHYMFYIDVSIGDEHEDFTSVIAELEAQGCAVSVLGSYSGGSSNEKVASN